MSIKLSNIRIHEAADYLGVSTKTLRRWEKSGKLPALRSEGNQRYYTKEQLDNFKSGIIPRALPTTHHLLSTVGFVLTWSMLFAPFGMGSLAIYKHINSNQKPSVLADAKINQPSVLAASDGDYTFNVNIPANFTDSVIFKKNITAPNVVYTFNGESGDINFELTGGDGITIEGSKITNSGIIELSAGDGISVDGNKITNTLVIPTPDYTLSGWTDSGTTVGLSTTTDSVVMDTVTFGNATVTNGKSIRPSNDLGSDLGSSGLRFNNLWVANINSNSSQSFSGQTTFSYPPTDTTISQASVLINPTTSVANGQLLGFGIAGFQRALVDAEGDMVLGYNSLTSAPATSYPLTIYGHNGTNVAYVDTSGNGYFAGNVNIAGLTASSAVYTDSSKNLTSTVPTSGALGYWTRSGTNLYNTTLTDNVGIGTTAPGALLDVKGNGQFGAAGDTQVIVRNRAIDIASANTGIYATTLNGLSALTLRSVSSTYPNILIYPNSTGNIILGHDGTNPVGKVGIGTTSPGTKLDVVGDIRATGASGTITSSVSMNTEAYYVSGAAALSYSTTDLKVGNNAFWQSIGLYTNGTRKVTIDSSGNVGIGTTAPGSKLDITVASAGNALQITNSSAATNKSWIMYPVTNGSSTDLRFYDTSDKMTLQAGGKVGIGTTNPTYKLEVNDTIGGTKAESDTIVYTNAAFTGNGAWWWLQGNTAHALNFGVYNSGSSLAAMTITQTGLVGIGTTSPTVKLQITDSARTPGLMLEAPDGAADRETITFRSSFSSTTHDGSISTSWYSAPVGMTFTSPRDETLGAFRFNSNGGTTRLYIDTTTGNVGIGTTAPISKLHVTGAVTGKALAIFDETGDQALLTASASGTTKFIIDHSGNVGIGTTNPATTLDVTGNVQASGVFQIKTTSQTFLQLKKSGTLDGEVYSNTGNLILQTSTAGNVGIGTTAPSNRLHVYTTTNADGLSVDGTSNPAIILRSSGVIKGYAPAIITSAGGFFNDSSVGDLAFRSESNKILLGVGSGASTLAISGSNVGIGTTAPGALLEIKGTTPTIIVRDSVDGILGQIGNADNLDPIGGTAGNFTIKYINNLGIANGTVR
ncbi:MAG TPA: helix-turn-helix domain-containing protein, partial [Alphaproteobacteria bacterium]|nr:helix-turn-helix domain-containing protein [Alphaproteobacteria bacterium]